MDPWSERQLCFMMSEMSPEQFARYMDEPVVSYHIAFCPNGACRRLFAETEAREWERISQRENLPESERWKLELSRRELLYMLAREGAII